MANEMQKTTPFGMRDKVGYMFGDFANDFTFILSSSFLMKFYTDVMGVSAGVVGMISEPDEGTRVVIHIPAIPYTKENAEQLEMQKYIQGRDVDEKE